MHSTNTSSKHTLNFLKCMMNEYVFMNSTPLIQISALTIFHILAKQCMFRELEPHATSGIISTVTEIQTRLCFLKLIVKSNSLFMTFVRSVITLCGTIFYIIFLIFNINNVIFRIILSISKNIVMNMNNVMLSDKFMANLQCSIQHAQKTKRPAWAALYPSSKCQVYYQRYNFGKVENHRFLLKELFVKFICV